MEDSQLSDTLKSMVPRRRSQRDWFAGTQRKRNRRNATVGAAAVAGLVALAVPVALQAMPPAQVANPADPPSTSAPTTPTPSPSTVEITPLANDQVLAAADIVARCAPQLQKYYDNEATLGALPREWNVAHADQQYRAGDLVRLVGGEGNLSAVTCLIPAAGQETEPVPFQALMPAIGDDARILQACNELLQKADGEPSERHLGTPDLRSAQVLSAKSAGAIVDVVIDAGDHRYGCTLSPELSGVDSMIRTDPAAWLPSQQRPSTMSPYDVAIDVLRTGPASASGLGEPATYVVMGAQLPVNATQIELTLGGSGGDGLVSASIDNGRLHAVVKAQDTVRQPVHYVIRDAAGKVLFDSDVTEPLSDAAILDSCATGVVRHGLTTEDLRKGTIATRATAGDSTFAVIHLGKFLYTCQVTAGGSAGNLGSYPVKLTADGDVARWDPWSDYRVSLEGYGSTSSGTEFYGFGDLPADAATIEFSGSATATVEVGEGGLYSYLVTGSSSTHLTYRVLDANGGVLFEGVALGDGAPTSAGDQ